MQLIAQNLTGRFVQLEPLAESHREGLRAAGSDPALWVYNPIDGSGAGFDHWFDARLLMHGSGGNIAFAVRRLAVDALVGSTCFLDIAPEHKRAQIGHTWYAKNAQASPVNPECKLLLMTHAFEAGANRVEFRIDARNAHSRAAVVKLGAKEEGIHRAHMIVRDGYIRDSVYFSIIRSEWPGVRSGLEARLADFPA